MAQVEFTVTKCTKNAKGSYVLTLVQQVEGIIFGQKKMVKRTCYIGGMPQEVAVGTKLIEDTNNFYTKEYPTARVIVEKDADGNPTKVEFADIKDVINTDKEYEILPLMWIHIKTAIDNTLRKAAA